MDGRLTAEPEGPTAVAAQPEARPRRPSRRADRPAARDRRRPVGLHGTSTSCAPTSPTGCCSTTSTPARGGAARHGRGGPATASRACARAGRAVGRPRRRLRAVRRRAAGRGRRPDRRSSRLKRILEIDLDNQRVCVEPGVTNTAVSAAVGPDVLLSAGPAVADRLLDRRQRGRELRRRALLQVRLHHELRVPGSRSCWPTGRWSRSAATSSTRPATTCSARSSAPRARSASRRRSGCGWCRRRRRCARWWRSSTPPARPGEAVSRDRAGRHRARARSR